MSRLDELIAELCPDGVEYKELGEIGELIRGAGLQKKDFVDNGVGCIHYGQIYTYYGTFADKTKSFVNEELAKSLKKVNFGDIVIAITSENVEDVCKCVAWLGDDEIVTGGHAAIFKHSQNPKYIAYYFQTQDFFRQKKKIATGTKVIEVSPAKLAKIKIPVPPLQVQREIVRILDNFAELTARRQQYEYYRDLLLTFNESTGDNHLTDGRTDGIKWLKIENICKKISSGGTPLKSRNDYYGGSIPWLRTQEVNWRYIYDTEIKITEKGLKNSSAQWIPINSIIVAMYGATAARAAISKIELTTNQACCNLQINEKVADFKYVFYWLSKNYFELKSLGQGSQSNINSEKIRNFIIPIPSIEEQKRIVSILDRFDALCNDITVGLPAEIEARRKQYEYYRDKLLNFKEKSA